MKQKYPSRVLFLFLIFWTPYTQTAPDLFFSFRAQSAIPKILSTLRNYFEKPTQNALMITTAVAGAAILATYTCMWKLWNQNNALQKKQKEYKELSERNSLLTTNNNDLRTQNDRLRTMLEAQQGIATRAQALHKATLEQMQRPLIAPSAPPLYPQPPQYQPISR
jgi:cell division protein FtsB